MYVQITVYIKLYSSMGDQTSRGYYHLCLWILASLQHLITKKFKLCLLLFILLWTVLLTKSLFLDILASKSKLEITGVTYWEMLVKLQPL